MTTTNSEAAAVEEGYESRRPGWAGATVQTGLDKLAPIFDQFNAAELDAIMLLVAAGTGKDREAWSDLAHYQQAFLARVRLGLTTGPDLRDWWESMVKEIAPDAPVPADRLAVLAALTADHAQETRQCFERDPAFLVEAANAATKQRIEDNKKAKTDPTLIEKETQL